MYFTRFDFGASIAFSTTDSSVLTATDVPFLDSSDSSAFRLSPFSFLHSLRFNHRLPDGLDRPGIGDVPDVKQIDVRGRDDRA